MKNSQFFLELKDFGKIILAQPNLLIAFSFWGLFFFFLPGQNIYQTAILNEKRSLLQSLNVSLPLPAPYPIKKNGAPPPYLTANSALVLDLTSSVVLYEKNPTEHFSPASTTKIMTALVALDEYNLSDILTVKAVEINGRVMGLKSGERLTFENLLYGLLVHSANDAALTIAENYPGGREKFILAMNRKAKKMNMENTHFTNEAGFEEPNHYISSIDLARLSISALGNPFFLQIIETRKITVKDLNGKETHYLENVNELLGKIPGLYGIKTGWTEDAGECLIAATERGGHKIITVVLKSEGRFGETEKLINWAFTNHKWLIFEP